VLSSCPKSLPVLRLIKCSCVQALQTIVSYSLSGVSSPPSSQCWTFIKVVGHVKSRLGMRASLRKAQTFGNYGWLRNACYITKATSERDGEAAHAG